MSADVIMFRPKHTVNVSMDDGFLCLVCGRWLWTSEVEWSGRIGEALGHGREQFSFCPACGAEVLTKAEWAEQYPQDQGKTAAEIRKRIGFENLRE